MLDVMMLAPDKRYLVAVSGGPDSMALLHLLAAFTPLLWVAHVDYHARPTSRRDRLLVEAACMKLGVPWFVYDAPPAPKQRNFQAWAREERYAFFLRLLQEHQLDAVVLAHQQDDFLETFLMKQAGKRTTQHASMAEQTILLGMQVLRPLWQIPRQALRDYCQQNQIAFGDDETNVLPCYERNRVRAHVTTLSPLARRALLEQMEQAQRHQQEADQRWDVLYEQCVHGEQLDLRCFCQAAPDDQLAILLRFLTQQDEQLWHSISPHFLKEASRQLCEAKANLELPYGKHGILRKEYEVVTYLRHSLSHPQIEPLVLKQAQTAQFGTWRIELQGNEDQGIALVDSDYPLTIRTWQPGDRIKLAKGQKKVSRLFIDAKIPPRQRRCYPLLFSREGTLLFIPGLYKENRRKRLQSTLYMIE